MSWCTTHEAQERACTIRHELRRLGGDTAALRACAWEQDWRSRGELAIQDEMERRVLAAYPIRPLVPLPPRRGPDKYSDAATLAAWLTLPHPRTIDRLATILGEHVGSLRSRLERHHLGSVKRLNAALAAAALT